MNKFMNNFLSKSPLWRLRGILFLICVLTALHSVAEDGGTLYDDLYDRPSFFPWFETPNKWPNNMTAFVQAFDAEGNKLENYEVAVYDQDGELRALGRSISSQRSLCSLTIKGTEGDVFSFRIIYGDFVSPDIRNTDATCEFLTNKSISAADPLILQALPTVVLYANEDPDNQGEFWSTFYDSSSAYSLPDNVSAYIARLKSEDEMSIWTLDNSTLAAGEAVILQSDDRYIELEPSSLVETPSAANQLQGVDVASGQQAGYRYYMLSYGPQYGLGFYKMNTNTLLGAHKAFLRVDEATAARSVGFRLLPDTDGLNTIEQTPSADNAIYNLNGIRMPRLERGINIIGGRTVIVSGNAGSFTRNVNGCNQ